MALAFLVMATAFLVAHTRQRDFGSDVNVQGMSISHHLYSVSVGPSSQPASFPGSSPAFVACYTIIVMEGAWE